LPIYEGVHHAGRRVEDDKAQEKRKNSGIGPSESKDAGHRPGSQLMFQNSVVFLERMRPSPGTRIHLPKGVRVATTNVDIWLYEGCIGAMPEISRSRPQTLKASRFVLPPLASAKRGNFFGK
jgi:hypothetical protein